MFHRDFCKKKTKKQFDISSYSFDKIHQILETWIRIYYFPGESRIRICIMFTWDSIDIILSDISFDNWHMRFKKVALKYPNSVPFIVMFWFVHGTL